MNDIQSQRNSTWPRLDFYSFFLREAAGLLISSVRMAGNSDTWIVREDSIQPFHHFVCAVGDDDLASMQRVTNSRATPVME
jgi:hypothetical protein